MSVPSPDSFRATPSAALRQALSDLDVEAVRQALLDGASVAEVDAELRGSYQGLVNYVLFRSEVLKDDLHVKAFSERLAMESRGAPFNPEAHAALKDNMRASLKDVTVRTHAVLSSVLRHAPSLPLSAPYKGMAPVHQASFLGHGPTVSLLVEHGADPAQISGLGRTAAHWAAKKGHVTLIRRLAGWGVSLDVQDQGGATPAHMAADEGQVPVMRALKRHGARLDKKDKSGRTAAQKLSLVDEKLGVGWRKWEHRFESQRAAERLRRKLLLDGDEALLTSPRSRFRF